MDYIINKGFPFGLEKNLLCQNELKSKGLRIIGKIDAKNIIQHSIELERLFKVIKSECRDKRLWVLLGSNDLKNWLPLQLASISAKNKDIRSEIKVDLNRMTPFDEESDRRIWKSEFHGAVMQVYDGLDTTCQKYSKLRESCHYFSIAILIKEEYDNEDDEIITKYQKKEIELAYELKPLLWNPSPKERQYIKRTEKL